MEKKNLTPKVLVLSGDGINCEQESAQAFNQAGAESKVIHISQLIKKEFRLKDFDLICLPGGFSYGDEIRSGKVLSEKLKKHLLLDLKEFVNSKKPIIGICNGFQILVQLELLPYPFGNRILTLSTNDHQNFINKWVNLEIDNSICIWTKGLNSELSLPVRHKEGKITMKKGFEEEIYLQLKNSGQLPLFYKNDINGSYKNIAGICDTSGTIFGLMPHPEAAIDENLDPSGALNLINSQKALQIFKNGVDYIKRVKNG